MLLQIQSAESSASSLNEDTSFAMRNENKGGNSHSVKPKNEKKNSSDNLLVLAAKVWNEPTDDLSVFGQYVATELRTFTFCAARLSEISPSLLCRRKKRMNSSSVLEVKILHLCFRVVLLQPQQRIWKSWIRPGLLVTVLLLSMHAHLTSMLSLMNVIRIRYIIPWRLLSRNRRWLGILLKPLWILSWQIFEINRLNFRKNHLKLQCWS